MTTITLLKTPTCTTNCSIVENELNRFDIDFEFIVIDETNTSHNAAVTEAREAGYLASPIACLTNDDGTLRYITAGPTQFAIQKIKKAAKASSSVRV